MEQPELPYTADRRAQNTVPLINCWAAPCAGKHTLIRGPGSSGKESACRRRNQETQVQSLGWEDPLEKGMAACSSLLAWRIPMDRGAWWAMLHGVTKSRTRLSTSEDLGISFLSLGFALF